MYNFRFCNLLQRSNPENSCFMLIGKIHVICYLFCAKSILYKDSFKFLDIFGLCYIDHYMVASVIYESGDKSENGIYLYEKYRNRQMLSCMYIGSVHYFLNCLIRSTEVD